MADRGSTPDRDSPAHELQKFKQALERTQRAQEAFRAAAEARDRAQSLLFLSHEEGVIMLGGVGRARDKGADQEEIAVREKQLAENSQEAADLEAELRAAAAEEQKALEELAAAKKELQERTVAPRVEAEKLRFEEHKLRATLKLRGHCRNSRNIRHSPARQPVLRWGASGGLHLPLSFHGLVSERYEEDQRLR